MNAPLHADYEYQVGGSLRVNAPSYVTRQADHDLYTALKAGQFCYVLNSRQMGKSSLRVQTMHRLRAEGIHCIAIDMTRIGSEHITPQQWYEQVISELWRGANLPGKVNLKAWFQDHADRGLIQLLIQFIEEVLLVHVSGAIVIFIDEIDSVLSLNFPVNDFFALIRACYNQRVDNPDYKRLTFCLLGVATPSDLMTDKIRTPFNIGRAIVLNGFQFEEAQSLATGLVGHVADSNAALKEILHWTGGQPFLTQKICRLVVEQTTPSVTQSITTFVENWISQDEPEHLRTIRDRILRDERLANRLLGLYRQLLQQGEIPADDSEGQQELRLSGLVVKQGSVLKIYNPIYAAVFNQEWVEMMLNNLRPYAEAFNAWIASNKQDESRLLRGQALDEALQWSTGRNLNSQDAEFLRISQAIENRETKQANQKLTQANRQAIWRLRIGGGLLGVAVLAAGAIGLWSDQSIDTAKNLTQVERSSSDALEQFKSDQTGALLAAMRSTYQLKQLTKSEVQQRYPSSSPIVALQKILDTIQEQRLAGSGYNTFQFTPDGDRVTNVQNTLLQTGEYNSKVTVWDLQGNLLANLNFTQQKGTINHAKLSPDGRSIVTIGEDCTARLWDFQGKPQAIFKSQGGALTNVQFSPNNQRVFTLEYDSVEGCSSQTSASSQTARVFDRQGKQLAIFKGLQLSGSAVQLSPKGDRILTLEVTPTVGTPSMRLWTLQGQPLAAFRASQQDGYISIAQFSPDGQSIATVDNSGVIKLWNLQGKPFTTFSSKERTEVIQFSPNGQQIVTGGTSGTIRLWNRQGQLIRAFTGYAGSVTAIEFSPNGQQLATIGETVANASGNSRGYLWTLQGQQLDTFRGHRTVQFSPDGQRIVSSSDFGVSIKYLTNPHTNSIRQKQGRINVVQFSPDGDRVATYSETDGTVRIWDKQGNPLGRLKVGALAKFESGYALRFSATGDRILTFNLPQNPNQEKFGVRVWNLQGQQVAFLAGAWWNELSTSSDKYYASVIDKMKAIRLWDLQGKVITTIQGEVDPSRQIFMNRVQISPSGNYILTTSNVAGSTLWNLKGQKLAQIEELKFHRVFFTQDEQRLIALGDDDLLKQWDLRGNLLTPIRMEFQSQSRSYSTQLKHSSVFNPKAGQFVTSIGDNAVLWDLHGKQLAFFAAQVASSPRNLAAQMQISDRGDRIATLGEDDKVRVWDAAGNQLGEWEGYAMALSPKGNQIAVVSQADNRLQLWQVSDVDGLLQRGCNWLRLTIQFGREESDRQMCGIQSTQPPGTQLN